MKRKLGWFLILTVIAGTLLVLLVPKKTMRNLYYSVKGSELEERETDSVIAVFDWDSKELKLSSDSFQYVNYRISNNDMHSSGQATDRDSRSPVFITVDIWNKFVSENPLESVLKGRYDKQILEMCEVFSKERSPVFIRWNPEMEVPANNYPWQKQSPAMYNQAFRHFSTLCKERLPGARIVWSTAGYPGVLEYYPGDEVIDYVSVTLQSKSEKSTKAFPDYKSVSDEVERKIHRMRFIKKPVMVLSSEPYKMNTVLAKQIAEANSSIRRDTTTIFGVLENSGSSLADTSDHRTKLQLGVVDPLQKLNREKEVSVEHVFLDWSGLQDGTFRKAFNEVTARKHDVIVTLEPWREKSGKPDPNVLISTVNGRYDDQITEIYNIMSNAGQTVFFRFAHEMEIPVSRYAWQSKSPVDYIKAFRYVATFKRPQADNIKIVWGPAGDRGLQDWWPGDDVVDYISMAIYGLPDKNITDYKDQESFKTIFHRKLYRMRFFNKPVFITEFGIKGPEDFQLKWLLEASKVINNSTQIKGICYFNMTDTPKAWGDIEAPNWSVSPTTFRAFIKSLALKVEDRHLVSK